MMQYGPRVTVKMFDRDARALLEEGRRDLAGDRRLSTVDTGQAGTQAGVTVRPIRSGWGRQEGDGRDGCPDHNMPCTSVEPLLDHLSWVQIGKSSH